MKFKIKSKALAILMSLAMVFTMMPLAAQKAYAKGNSPAVVKSGDLYNFAKDAPITTVRIDGSKLKKDYAELTYQMNAKYSNNKFEWGKTSAGNRDCVVINDLTTEDTSAGDDGVMLPGSFALTYKNAAIMRDGTTKDLIVTYTPEIRMKKDTASYTDSFTIMAFQSRKPGISIQPLTKERIHFGLIVNITCQVVDADKDDTFLIVSDEINTARTTNNFQQIVYAESNNNYGEAINFVSGVDGESEVYLPSESTLNTSPSDITGKNGYQVRFLATSAATESLNHVAAVASASGIQAKIWSSAGATDFPLDLYYLDATKDVFTKEHTSSSGEGGKIELWTDGLTHNTDSEANNFRKLSGGTIATPYTYAVPYGKTVTYRMPPDEGYILDKLYVNESETDPTNIVYKPDSPEIAYYEYHFDSDSVNSDQEISVTWKKYAATTNPIPVRKVITGSAPDKDQEFSFALERVPESDAPIDGAASNNADKIILKVLKGQSKTASEIPGLTFKRPGEYIYTVRELNEKVAGYTYDGKIYTVRYMIEPDSYDPDILICTNQTILDGENEVESCVFVNDYKSEQKPTPTPAPTPKPVAPKISGTPLAKVTAKGKTSLTISWNKIQGAAGYDIFFARCNHDNKKIATKNVKTIKGNKTFKWTKSGLKKGTAYKAYVRAYVYKNGKKTYVRNSPLMHAYTGNGTKNYTNAKSVKLKNVKKGKLSLKQGKTFKIKAKVNKINKNKKLMPKSHATTLRYMTSNSKIASVNSGGKITAKGKGTCYIYVYAHNGVSKQVKVTIL